MVRGLLFVIGSTVRLLLARQRGGGAFNNVLPVYQWKLDGYTTTSSHHKVETMIGYFKPGL